MESMATGEHKEEEDLWSGTSRAAGVGAENFFDLFPNLNFEEKNEIAKKQKKNKIKKNIFLNKNKAN